jgi:hypothetical protein
MSEPTQPGSTTRLPRRWRLLAQTTWLIVVVVGLGLLIAGTREKFRQPLPENCAAVECDTLEFTADDVALIHELGLPAELFTLLMPTLLFGWNLSFVAMALLIFWRRADDWMALLLSATLATLGSVAFGPANDTLLTTHPEWNVITAPLETMAYLSLLLLLLIFPEGRFVPRWTRFAVVLPLLMFWIETPWLVFLLMFIGYAGIGIYAQIYRYRRVSNPMHRQQTKWVAFGVLSIVAIMGIWIFVTETFPLEQPTVARAYLLLFGIPLILAIGMLFPVCIAVAILRYRLWAIDVIIRRTLVYTVLSALLALAYFGSVVVLQSIFRALTGQGQNAAITVISTLAIALLFTPLHGRVQYAIDHRFYRRKYDAEQVLAAFGAMVRNETELERLTTALLRVVDETMQPAQVLLWLGRTKEEGKSSQKGV